MVCQSLLWLFCEGSEVTEKDKKSCVNGANLAPFTLFCGLYFAKSLFLGIFAPDFIRLKLQLLKPDIIYGKRKEIYHL